MPKVQLYVVVCVELHYSVGPFIDLGSALKAARLMTNQDKCVYLPVPLHAEGAEVIFHNEKPDEDYQTGQYL